MHICKQAGFLPQWSIICIGKYRLPHWIHVQLYISIYVYIHIYSCSCCWLLLLWLLWLCQLWPNARCNSLAFSLSAMSRLLSAYISIVSTCIYIYMYLCLCVACIYNCGMRHCPIAVAIAFSSKLPASSDRRVL